LPSGWWGVLGRKASSAKKKNPQKKGLGGRGGIHLKEFLLSQPDCTGGRSRQRKRKREIQKVQEGVFSKKRSPTSADTLAEVNHKRGNWGVRKASSRAVFTKWGRGKGNDGPMP